MAGSGRSGGGVLGEVVGQDSTDCALSAHLKRRGRGQELEEFLLFLTSE